MKREQLFSTAPGGDERGKLESWDGGGKPSERPTNQAWFHCKRTPMEDKLLQATFPLRRRRKFNDRTKNLEKFVLQLETLSILSGKVIF